MPHSLWNAGTIAAVTSIAVASPAKAEWIYQSAADPLTDKPLVAVSAQSTIPTNSNSNQAAGMFIGCSDGKTSVFVSFGPVVYKSTVMDYRVDKRPPKKFTSMLSNSYIVQGDDAVAFASELLDGSTVYLRSDTAFMGSVEARFDLSGLGEAIKPVREACKW